MKNNLTSGSARLDQKPAAETARTLDEDSGKHVKIYTDRSKMGDKVEYAVVKEFCLKTRCSVRNSLQLLKQSNRGKQQTRNSINNGRPKAR
jgi:tRNA A37 threonylcarbamoyladenosine synthetase subunit TsaC/SUA5/YrdC